jgi:hypothetical protein
MPAGKVFVVMLVCLLLWGFLFAPTMKRAAEASPDGARRSAALAILTPFVAINDALQIAKLTTPSSRRWGAIPTKHPVAGSSFLPNRSRANREPARLRRASTPRAHPEADRREQAPCRGGAVTPRVGAGGVPGARAEAVARRVSRQGRISTGLARPDYFDWPAALSEDVDNFRPDRSS